MGELFIDIDSDDYMLSDTLEVVVKQWDSIDNKDVFIRQGNKQKSVVYIGFYARCY